MKQAIKKCQDAGLIYETGGKHPRIVNPNTGRFVPISATPSDTYAHKQMLRDVRKYLGVNLL